MEGIILDKAATLVLYCGDGLRSLLATKSLETMEYQNVLSMAADGSHGSMKDILRLMTEGRSWS